MQDELPPLNDLSWVLGAVAFGLLALLQYAIRAIVGEYKRRNGGTTEMRQQRLHDDLSRDVRGQQQQIDRLAEQLGKMSGELKMLQVHPPSNTIS